MMKLYLALMQRFSRRTLARQPEMDMVMIDHVQDSEFYRDGEEGSLAVLYELIVNALLRLSPKEGKALDICCGSGSLLCRVAKAMPRMHFTGVDLSANMLNFAEEHRRRLRLKNVNFCQADMYKLSQTLTSTYDLITWHLAMHHCQDAASVIKVLTQVKKLLKPGGTLFVFDINRPKSGRLALMLADLYNRRQGDWYYQDSLDSYKAAFSFEEVEEILRQAGLQDARHVQPKAANFFQAFYLSQTDDLKAAPVSNFGHWWQKIDHTILKLFFHDLPTAIGRKRTNKGGSTATLDYVPETWGTTAKVKDFMDILEIGTRAMSAYNIQPWRFRIDADDIYIHCIRHKNFFLKLEGVYYMMIGHLLANITAGAASKGYRANYEILSDALSIDRPCVRLRLVKESGQWQNIDHVMERTTNRGPYSDQELQASLKHEILDLCDNENISICFSEGKDKTKLANVLAELEEVRLKNFKLALEALAFVRFQEGAGPGDHLNAAALGFGPLTRMFLGWVKKVPVLLHSSTVFWCFQMTPAFKALVRRQQSMVHHSGTMIMFLIKSRGYRDFIALGIVIQSVANKISQYGAVSMPMLSGLYLLDVMHENPEILSSLQQKTVARSLLYLSQFFELHDERIAFILRAGYSKLKTTRTERRDIHELVYVSGQTMEHIS